MQILNPSKGKLWLLIYNNNAADLKEEIYGVFWYS